MSKVCQYCDKPLRSASLCSAHHYRLKKYGDPLATRPKRYAPAVEWFMNAMEYRGDECMLWPFYRSPEGYARVTIDGKFVFASRYACELENGPPPSPEYQAAHSCGKGHAGCINRMHVTWKTVAENIADKWTHGTMLIGEKHHQAKLTEKEVVEIRALRGKISRRQLSEMYGAGRSTIDNIIDGVTWRHV